MNTDIDGLRTNLANAFNESMEALGEDILDDLDADQIEALDDLRTAIAAFLPKSLANELTELY